MANIFDRFIKFDDRTSLTAATDFITLVADTEIVRDDGTKYKKNAKGAWDKIGVDLSAAADIDLTDYVTVTDLSTALSTQGGSGGNTDLEWTDWTDLQDWRSNIDPVYFCEVTSPQYLVLEVMVQNTSSPATHETYSIASTNPTSNTQKYWYIRYSSNKNSTGTPYYIRMNYNSSTGVYRYALDTTTSSTYYKVKFRAATPATMNAENKVKLITPTQSRILPGYKYLSLQNLSYDVTFPYSNGRNIVLDDNTSAGGLGGMFFYQTGHVSDGDVLSYNSNYHALEFRTPSSGDGGGGGISWFDTYMSGGDLLEVYGENQYGETLNVDVSYMDYSFTSDYYGPGYNVLEIEFDSVFGDNSVDPRSLNRIDKKLSFFNIHTGEEIVVYSSNTEYMMTYDLCVNESSIENDLLRLMISDAAARKLGLK